MNESLRKRSSLLVFDWKNKKGWPFISSADLEKKNILILETFECLFLFFPFVMFQQNHTIKQKKIKGGFLKICSRRLDCMKKKTLSRNKKDQGLSRNACQLESGAAFLKFLFNEHETTHKCVKRFSLSHLSFLSSIRNAKLRYKLALV